MLIVKPYRRDRAVEYARKWALSRNPLFFDFTGIGGNCTNFVSQCLLSGSCVMNYTSDFGWYYISPDDRAPAWSSVRYLYDFLLGVPDFSPSGLRVGPFAVEVPPSSAEPGDVIQLCNSDGVWYHSVLLSGFSGSVPLVCAQSDDSLDRPLSSYRFASSRFLHISGVRIDLDDDSCFSILLSGGEA